MPVRGNPKVPLEREFIFDQIEETIMTGDTTTIGRGCCEYTIRSNLPQFPFDANCGTITANSLVRNQQGGDPFNRATLTARTAFSDYQYGVVTKSELTCVVRPLSQVVRPSPWEVPNYTLQTPAPDSLWPNAYAPEAAVYLSSTLLNKPHGDDSSEVEANEANQLLCRQSRTSTAFGHTRFSLGDTPQGCTLKQTYTPKKLFKYQDGSSWVDNMDDFQFTVTPDPTVPSNPLANYLQKVTGNMSAAYYTLTIVSKAPVCITGSKSAAGFKDVFQFGRIVPHSVTWHLKTYVTMFNIVTEDLYLGFNNLGTIKLPEGGAAQMDAEEGRDFTQASAAGSLAVGLATLGAVAADRAAKRARDDL